MARRVLQSFFRHPSPLLPRNAPCSHAPATPFPIRSCTDLLPSKVPWILASAQHYAKRRSKLANDPYAWVNVGENEPCPSSQPNKGSVKNRNHKKRMAQRDAFIKEQCQKRIQECRAAEAKRLEARKKRWKEGAARARAWKEKKAKEAEAKAKEAEANAARKAEEEETEQPGLAMAA